MSRFILASIRRIVLAMLDIGWRSFFVRSASLETSGEGLAWQSDLISSADNMAPVGLARIGPGALRQRAFVAAPGIFQRGGRLEEAIAAPRTVNFVNFRAWFIHRQAEALHSGAEA